MAQELVQRPQQKTKPPTSWMRVFVTVLALLVTGAIAGAVAAAVILTIAEVLAQIGEPTATAGAAMLRRLVGIILQVVAVSAQAPVDGAKMGLAAGGAVAIVYTALAIFRQQDGGGATANGRTWSFFALLALAGAVGAALGSWGVLADNRLWTTVAGGLFGLAAALALSQPARKSG